MGSCEEISAAYKDEKNAVDTQNAVKVCSNCYVVRNSYKRSKRIIPSNDTSEGGNGGTDG